MNRFVYLFFLLLTLPSCAKEDTNTKPVEAILAASVVQNKWAVESKQLEICVVDGATGVNEVGVKLVDEKKANYHTLKGNTNSLLPNHPSTKADSATPVAVCWPPQTRDTVRLMAPFTDNLLGEEVSRHVANNTTVKVNLQSQMAVLRIYFESNNFEDKLEKVMIKGDGVYTKGIYKPFNGTWVEKAGEGQPISKETDCMVNSGKYHDFFLIPYEMPTDIAVLANINGKNKNFKTKLPALTQGSMIILNLKTDSKENLGLVSSWVEPSRVADLSLPSQNTAVKVGHYLRKDGFIVSMRDSLCVAVVYQTDGKHGKAIGLKDVPGKFALGGNKDEKQKIYPTLDGVRREGIVNDSNVPRHEMLIYKPDMKFPRGAAFSESNGANLTTQLLKASGETREGTAINYMERQSSGYIPSITELVHVFYLSQPYSKYRIPYIMPLNGEYLSSTPSDKGMIYGIAMHNGVVIANYSQNFSKLNLRLFYLF